MAEVRRPGMTDEVALISFDHRALLHCREVAPEIVRGHLFGRTTTREVLEAARDADSRIVMPHKSQIQDEMAESARKAGLKFATWVVDDPEELKALRPFGLYGVGSNHPGVLLQALADGLLEPR